LSGDTVSDHVDAVEEALVEMSSNLVGGVKVGLSGLAGQIEGDDRSSCGDEAG
jgi:hypothetical protein